MIQRINASYIEYMHQDLHASNKSSFKFVTIEEYFMISLKQVCFYGIVITIICKDSLFSQIKILIDD